MNSKSTLRFYLSMLTAALLAAVANAAQSDGITTKAC